MWFLNSRFTLGSVQKSSKSVLFAHFTYCITSRVHSSATFLASLSTAGLIPEQSTQWEAVHMGIQDAVQSCSASTSVILETLMHAITWTHKMA